MKYKPGDTVVSLLDESVSMFVCTADYGIYQYDIFENGQCVCAATSCSQYVFENEVRPMTKLEKALK